MCYGATYQQPSSSPVKKSFPRKRRRLNSEQISQLEVCYHNRPYLSTKERFVLSKALNLTETQEKISGMVSAYYGSVSSLTLVNLQVKIWFQNRRAKSKRISALSITVPSVRGTTSYNSSSDTRTNTAESSSDQ
eukprot:sb/3474837/